MTFKMATCIVTFRDGSPWKVKMKVTNWKTAYISYILVYSLRP